MMKKAGEKLAKVRQAPGCPRLLKERFSISISASASQLVSGRPFFFPKLCPECRYDTQHCLVFQSVQMQAPEQIKTLLQALDRRRLLSPATARNISFRRSTG
ncbi:MAG: hypothetical protein C4530_21250 [Desulfobacteraceae bacterium]|nr:MAG: hypothetical protein C4530_21250 [Desulfobacteraceae bacterium]